LALPLESGHLLHCRDCDLSFRFPSIAQEELNTLYSALPPSVWQTVEPRSHWQAVLSLMEAHSPNRLVLDVGCFCGDFLGWLPQDWRKLGIEPNVQARAVAAGRCVEIVGDVIAPPSIPQPAGVITLLDVLEHMVHPLDALAKLVPLLAAGGSLIVLTGAADCWAWRLFGTNYWYSSLPEHVSFFTLRWFQWAATKLGLSVASVVRLSSVRSDARRSLFNFLRLCAYSSVRELRGCGVPEGFLRAIPLVRRVIRWQLVPWWQEANDHMLVLLARS
jgi:SAM-dependent methyltransferase